MSIPPVSVYFQKTSATPLYNKLKSAGKIKNRLMLETPRDEFTGKVARFALSKNKIYSADEIKESKFGAYFRKQNMCNYVWVHVNATDEKDEVRDGYVRLNKNSLMKRLISLNILTKQEFRDHLKNSNDFTKFLQPLLPGKPTLDRTASDEQVTRYDKVTDLLSFTEGTLTSVEKFAAEVLAAPKLDVGQMLYLAQETKTLREQLDAIKADVDKVTAKKDSKDPKNAAALQQLEEGYAAAEKRAGDIDEQIKTWLKTHSADVDSYLTLLTDELKKMPKPKKPGQPRTSAERRAVLKASLLRKVLTFTGRMTKANRQFLEGYVGAPGHIPNLMHTYLGYSCYLSTALQSLFAVPVLRNRIHQVAGDTPVKRALKELLTAWEAKNNDQIGQKVADLRVAMMRSGDMTTPFGDYEDADLPAKVIGEVLGLNYGFIQTRMGQLRDDPANNYTVSDPEQRFVWPNLDTAGERSVQEVFNEQCRLASRMQNARTLDGVPVNGIDTRYSLDPAKALPPLMVFRVGTGWEENRRNYPVNTARDAQFSASEAYADKRAADYELVSIMEHTGGHWKAKARYPDGWYDCDDLGGRVRKIGANLPADTPGTLLVYQLRQAAQRQPDQGGGAAAPV